MDSIQIDAQVDGRQRREPIRTRWSRAHVQVNQPQMKARNMAARTTVSIALTALLGLGLSGCAAGSDNDGASGSTASGTDTNTSNAETEDSIAESTEPEDVPAVSVPLPLDANPALAVVGVESLPDGEPGQLSVVAQASTLDDTGSLPVVVRNLTNDPLANIELTGTIRDSSGALLESGSSQGFDPYVVNPGEIAIGYVYFGRDELPEGTTFELEAVGDEVDERYGKVDLIVAEQNRTAESIVVMLRNETDAEVTGPVGLTLMCFDDDATPVRSHTTYTDKDTAAPGAEVAASFSFYGDAPCERYIVGGSGFRD